MNEAALEEGLLLSYQRYDIPTWALTAYLYGWECSLSEHVAIYYRKVQNSFAPPKSVLGHLFCQRW